MNVYEVHTQYRAFMYAGTFGCGIGLQHAVATQHPGLLAGAVLGGLALSAGLGYLDHIAKRAYVSSIHSLATLVGQVQKRGYTVIQKGESWELKG